jgi:hypothetical protein
MAQFGADTKPQSGRAVHWGESFQPQLHLTETRPVQIKLTSRSDAWVFATDTATLAGSAGRVLALPPQLCRSTKAALKIACCPYCNAGLSLLGHLAVVAPTSRCVFTIGSPAYVVYQSTERSASFEIDLSRFEPCPSVGGISLKVTVRSQTSEVGSIERTLGEFLQSIGDEISCGKAMIVFKDLVIKRHATFEDFIHARNPIILNFAMAMDFSGEKKLPDMGDNSTFARCIGAVASVFSAYDTDGEFPVLGLGITGTLRAPGFEYRLPPCFPLTLDEERWLVHGIDQVRDCGRWAIAKFTEYKCMIDPKRLWDKVIQTAGERAENAYWKKRMYSVLFLLTESVPRSLDENLKTAIVNASWLPLSIAVIVLGKTPGNFEGLDTSPGSRAPSKESPARDVVRCYNFSNYENDVKFSSALLAGIRKQFLEWAQLVGLSP